MASSGLLRSLRPYLTLADSFDKTSPVVAYYSRVYAVGLGKDMPNRTKEDTMELLKLMDRLEQDKPKIDNDRNAHEEAVLEISQRLFELADKEDQSGNAGKGTAIKFRTCSLVLDVLSHFRPLPDDLAQCRKYCKWKTTDIMKALQEGRKPTPGGWKDGLEDEEDEDKGDDEEKEPASSHDHRSSTSDQIQPSSAQPLPVDRSQVVRSMQMESASRRQNLRRGPVQRQPVPEQFVIRPSRQAQGWDRHRVCTSAEDLTKEALSALRFDDVDVAVERLQSALSILMHEFGQVNEDEDDLTTDSDDE